MKILKIGNGEIPFQDVDAYAQCVKMCEEGIIWKYIADIITRDVKVSDYSEEILGKLNKVLEKLEERPLASPAGAVTYLRPLEPVTKPEEPVEKKIAPKSAKKLLAGFGKISNKGV